MADPLNSGNCHCVHASVELTVFFCLSVLTYRVAPPHTIDSGHTTGVGRVWEKAIHISSESDIAQRLKGAIWITTDCGAVDKVVL